MFTGPVVDLVNPYHGKGVIGTEYAVWWLKRHPGRWAMMTEDGVGPHRDVIKQLGLEYGMRGRHTFYARVPHPEGESLTEALARSRPRGLYFPELERDPFDWTDTELAAAVGEMRSKLYLGRWQDAA